MKTLKTASAEIIFSVEVENTTTDAVTGSTWTGDAYGSIIFSKATASNPMWDFEFSGTTVKATNGASKAVTAFAVNRNTGYVGVVYNSPAVGDVVTIAGTFAKEPTDRFYKDAPQLGATDAGVSVVKDSGEIKISTGKQIFVPEK